MMKHSICKKSLAVLSAGIVCLTTMPAIPFTGTAASSVILSNDFSSGYSGWSTYQASGGNARLDWKMGNWH